MLRKFLLSLMGVALLSLAGCGEYTKETEEPLQGSKYVKSVEMDDSYLNSYTGLRCVEGYQPFDIDNMDHTYGVLRMKVVVSSKGEYYPDDPKTKDEYEGFYAQDWVHLKMTLAKGTELPVVIIHALDSVYSNLDDQTVVPEVGRGGQVDIRLVTDNYLGGGVGQIEGLTLCLKVA